MATTSKVEIGYSLFKFGLLTLVVGVVAWLLLLWAGHIKLALAASIAAALGGCTLLISVFVGRKRS
jgi:Flp pilus assembly protein TadB